MRVCSLLLGAIIPQGAEEQGVLQAILKWKSIMKREEEDMLCLLEMMFILRFHFSLFLFLVLHDIFIVLHF